MSGPGLSDHELDLLAEYLSLATTLDTKDQPNSPSYIRTNLLAFRLGLCLPVALWRQIIQGLHSGNAGGIWEAVFAVRRFQGIEGTGADRWTLNDAVYHKPGIGAVPELLPDSKMLN